MNPRKLTVVRLWAALDLVVTGVFVLPPVAMWVLGVLLDVNAWFGGQAHTADFSGFGLLFLCLTGTLGVTWALARLIRPGWWLGMIDAVARLWVGALIVYFVFAHGVPGILLLFVISEWAGGLHQGWALLNSAKPTSVQGATPV